MSILRTLARRVAVEWRYFQKDGRWFARETNTMPQWAGSCWYYLRFLDPHNDRAMSSLAFPHHPDNKEVSLARLVLRLPRNRWEAAQPCNH